MIRLTAILTASAVLVLSVTACGVTFDDGPHVKQNRDVASFDRVDVHGSTAVVVRPGPAGVVTVSGGRDRVRELVTRVEDDTLIVETPDSDGMLDLDDDDVTVIARAPSVEAARIDGSGDVTLSQLRGERLAVEINGSGDVSASGQVGAIDAAVDGSGDLRLGDLAADDVKIDVSGSGDADVDARRHLDVDLRGSGDVHYSGEPELSQNVEGSGSVERG